MRAIVHVCSTCRGQSDSVPDPDGTRAGAHLVSALTTLPLPEGVEIRVVECLSACAQGCAIALTAPGKWSYVYGRMSPDHAAEILTGAARYAQAQDGVVPWRDRPEIFRKQSLARIPPLALED
ncbi:DUF1636 domain-containing protein [Gemmobacter serpentinus]|uniref:DUF1636 domain-containing protein n=1 Tax=Gemmobacter serpentinus TaxID=2652247 RepID=UPI00124DBE2D|nr:DUF1636 domain-containing protein [Gemmobacter serpentinus]